MYEGSKLEIQVDCATPDFERTGGREQKGRSRGIRTDLPCLKMSIISRTNLENNFRGGLLT